jgi:polyphenol oxidase
MDAPVLGALWPGEIAWVRQVHSNEVLVPRCGGVIGEGDALVTREPSLALGLLGADCALVAFSSAEQVRAVAHAGWRGLLSGVIQATVEEMRRLGAESILAVASPMIHPCCYEFSPEDLAPLTERYGSSVATTTSSGAPALDLPRGIALACSDAEISFAPALGGCTSCDGRYFSWRRDHLPARHALILSGRP